MMNFDELNSEQFNYDLKLFIDENLFSCWLKLAENNKKKKKNF